MLLGIRHSENKNSALGHRNTAKRDHISFGFTNEEDASLMNLAIVFPASKPSTSIVSARRITDGEDVHHAKR